MRVPVGRLRRRQPGEKGAVAVTVALLSVVLVGISAFSVDFGMSYVSTRQLQSASDAAALAAAATYGNASGTCATRAADATLRSSAQSAVDALRGDNRAGSTGSITDVRCTADSKGVQVTYSSSGSTPSLFGGVFGRSSGYTNDRSATASVGVPPSGLGVRPYALCGSQIPTTMPSPVFKMTLPSQGNNICPGAASSGNWWSIDCPEAPSNSTQYLGTATANGCTSPIFIVPNQAPRTGGALRNYLEGSCNNVSSSCLGANSGNLGGTPILQAWMGLVSARARILLPVFCGIPPCDQAAVVNGGGNNAIYPVQSLIGVIVCGYHFGTQNDQNSNSIAMTGECGGTNNPDNLTALPGSNQENYLLLRAVRLQTSGGSSDYACALGDGCDTGNFAVHLIQ